MTRYNKIYRATNNSILNNRGGDRLKADARRMKMCLNKIGYDTEFEAEVMAAKRRLRAYKCQYCPHFHLTSH